MLAPLFYFFVVLFTLLFCIQPYLTLTLPNLKFNVIHEPTSIYNFSPMILMFPLAQKGAKSFCTSFCNAPTTYTEHFSSLSENSHHIHSTACEWILFMQLTFFSQPNKPNLVLCFDF